jgi:hypothetical protein
VAFRGKFERKPRVSILAFIGINGIINYTDTDGTFDRIEFVNGCQAFIDSPEAAVHFYPGRHSVWKLDGATIHRHPAIVHYLRSRGIVVIFYLHIDHSTTQSRSCLVTSNDLSNVTTSNASHSRRSCSWSAMVASIISKASDADLDTDAKCRWRWESARRSRRVTWLGGGWAIAASHLSDFGC